MIMLRWSAFLHELACPPHNRIFRFAHLMRFMEPTRTFHAGDAVEWTNSDPVTAHTITFGTEPANAIPPSANVTLDADGARHATINAGTYAYICAS